MSPGKIRPALGGAVYVLPNLFTTGNLFFGYFSIIKCLQGDLFWAGSALALAAIFDALDGRIARLTGGTSEFGVQYDSLCDLVSFGLAPAFIMYKSGLEGVGRPGWIVCFLFLACGALRLARFNVQSSIGKANGDFTGLPIPMAAMVIALFTAATFEIDEIMDTFPGWLLQAAHIFKSDVFSTWFFLITGPLLAVAMVSNLSYRSHKSIRVTGVPPFRLLVVGVMVMGLVAYQPAVFGFVFSFLYALSGVFEWLIGWKKPTEDSDIFASDDNEDVMEPSL